MTPRYKLPHVDVLQHQLAGLSTKDALTMLVHKYRRSTQDVFLGPVTTTVGRMLTNLSERDLNLPCSNFTDIRFFGGPPGQAKFYNGSILTLLCDAVLFEEYNEAPFEIAIGI